MQKPSKRTVVRLGIWAGIIAIFASLGPAIILDIDYWYQNWSENNADIEGDEYANLELFEPTEHRLTDQPRGGGAPRKKGPADPLAGKTKIVTMPNWR